MKKFVKMASVIVAGAVCTAALCGCGGEKKADDAAAVQTEGVAKSSGETRAGGVTINEGLKKYYVYMKAMGEMYSETGGDIDPSSFDWDKTLEDGTKLEDRIKRDAFSEMVLRGKLAELGEKNGITLSDEEKETAKKNIEQAKSQGEESFLQSLSAMGISSEEDYIALYNTEVLNQKIENDFSSNHEKYTGDVNLEDYLSDSMVTAQHILIKNDSTKYENPKETIDEVLKKAKSGEDFKALMKEYNEDTGETESGYSFGKGEMVKEFEEASFALKPGEISDVVETQYGYHVIKRVTGLAEFKNYLLSTTDLSEANKIMSDISVKQLITELTEAQAKLQAAAAQNGQSTGGSNNG
ncbi:MAG: peptidylprolyl isomerase [Monoglobaceae bacterium]